MNDVPRWLLEHGVVLPSNSALIRFAIAGALVLASLAIGFFAGRRFGPSLSRLWEQNVGGHAEGLAPRMSAIVRHLIALLLLALLLYADTWPPIAAFPIGLALGAAAARAAAQVLRGLNLPRWMAWLIATVVFIALFSNAVGGLSHITALLEMIGFNVGARRLSLLAVIRLLVTVVALLAAVRLANRVIAHSIGRTKSFDPTQKLLAQKLTGIAVLVAAFFFGLDLLSIDLTVFTVFSGAFGLAVGFGLQKTIGNLIAGIILLMDRSIKPGDVIVVGDSFGWVNKIGVRAVSVVTRDGKEHLIPNENLMTQEVENWSYSDRNVRIRIPVGIDYSSDLKLAQKLMLQAAAASPRVLKSPKPNVWLTSYGSYAVEHEVLVWISDPEGGVGSVRSDVLNRLWVLFKEHQIIVPVPQQDLRVTLERDAPAKPLA